MNRISRLNLLAGAAVAALAVPCGAFATDVTPAVSEAPADTQEIVVTANKREERLLDVAQSVTAITGDTLQLQQAVHFEDYVTRIPGFNLVSSQAGESRLVLDGINAGGVSSTIGTYVDETPYGSVTGLANGAVLAPTSTPSTSTASRSCAALKARFMAPAASAACSSSSPTRPIRPTFPASWKWTGRIRTPVRCPDR